MTFTELQMPTVDKPISQYAAFDDDKEEKKYRIEYPLKGRRLMESYRLRSKVFTRELNWVGEISSNFEVDEFDRFAEHLGVIDENDNLVATIRFVSNSQVWLSEKYFPKILPENFYQLKSEEPTVELSRLSVDPSVRAVSVDGKWSVVDLLYKGVFRYCMDHSIYKAYTPVSLSLLRHIRRSNMPARKVGPVVTMPDGVKTTLVLVDWDEFLLDTSDDRKAKLDWLMDVKSLSLDASPWQRPGSDSSQTTCGICS